MSLILYKISSKIKKIKDISYINIDDFENDKEILEFIKDTFGYKESADIKLCLKHIENNSCPIELIKAKNILLGVSDSGEVLIKDVDSGSKYKLNNDHSKLIAI